MTTDLDSLLIALYVRIDDSLVAVPRCGRPAADELRRRIRSLRSGDRSIGWHAIP